MIIACFSEAQFYTINTGFWFSLPKATAENLDSSVVTCDEMKKSLF